MKTPTMDGRKHLNHHGKTTFCGQILPYRVQNFNPNFFLSEQNRNRCPICERKWKNLTAHCMQE